MKNVNKELGLAEDAPEASTVAEVQTIKNRATTLQSQVTALTKERDTLLTAQIERDLDDHKDVIADREAVKAQLVANRAGTLVVLGGLKKPAKKDPPARITNRDGATPPEADPAASAEETAADKSRAAKIANRASELRKTTPSLTRSQAFQKAQDELTA
jgi:hypothetical protein